MERTEFLAVLEDALRGEIPEYEIKEHIRYYESYICANDGKTEEEKLNELGDPRLIAKTIIEARQSKEGQTSDAYDYESERNRYTGESTEQTQHSQVHYKSYSWDTMTWYQKLLVILILLLVVVVILAVVKVGVRIFFSLVLPILLVVFLVRFLMSLFR